ncbi:MAG: hypothetical protein NTW07_10050 [candidate division Zixibacteria bacterium]|nr:hypothetical protein [candidate division Zixibacteria bacterium]
MAGSKRTRHTHLLVLEQIVELLAARFFVVDARLDAAGGLDNLTHLKEIAEVGFVFVPDGMVDIFPTLVTARRIEVAAAATGAKVSLAILALIVPGHAPFDTGGPSATPAEQAFFAQFTAVQRHEEYYSRLAGPVKGE